MVFICERKIIERNKSIYDIIQVTNELIREVYRMRRKEDRTSQILELLVKEKKLEVAELSAHLGVSQVTVRKDLDAMEAQGLITREHGFAVLSSTDDIKGRLAYHYEEKRKIALRAAEAAVGREHIVDSRACLASEDFAVFGEQIPSFLYWVGSGTPGKKCASWHDPAFCVDPHYLETAVPVLCSSALIK